MVSFYNNVGTTTTTTTATAKRRNHSNLRRLTCQPACLQFNPSERGSRLLLDSDSMFNIFYNWCWLRFSWLFEIYDRQYWISTVGLYSQEGSLWVRRRTQTVWHAKEYFYYDHANSGTCRRLAAPLLLIWIRHWPGPHPGSSLLHQM